MICTMLNWKELEGKHYVLTVWMWTGRKDYIKCLGENTTYFWRSVHDPGSMSPAFHPVSSLWSSWSIVLLTHAAVFLIWTNMLTLKSLKFSLFILKEVTPPAPPPDLFFLSIHCLLPFDSITIVSNVGGVTDLLLEFTTWVIIPCRLVMDFHIHDVF